MNTENNNISFEMPKNQSSTIKVIGVGGGGSNAVNHMFSQEIKGVDFVICNTDAQALENSGITNKIQLGAHLTSGLGAGANPDVGAQAAAESIQEIQQMLDTKTKMVFITAGMGGGTGTGAAPIIARIAKDMDILTVGIVTMPFGFEGKMRAKQAQKGVDELRKNVDSLIVINNNKLREVYGNLGISAGYSKADEVLATAAKGIAEVITSHYKQNIDLHDAKTVLSNSGTAIMGSAKESGEDRAKKAIQKALDSPLLNDNKISGAKNVLLLIISGANEVTIDEIGEINDYIQEEAGHNANIIMGAGDDPSLEDGISVTIVATGFAPDQQGVITNTEQKKIVHTLEDNQKATYSFDKENEVSSSVLENPISSNKKIVYSLDEEEHLKSNASLYAKQSIEEIVEVKEVMSVSEDDFVILEATPQEEKVEPSQELLFDFSEQVQEVSQNLIVDTTEEIRNIEVVAEEIKVIPQNKRVVHVLQDFDVSPTIGKSSQPSVTQEEVREELQFKMRSTTGGTTERSIIESEEVSPLSSTISELENSAAKRRKNLKSFNHQFKDQMGKRIEEIESQPAYKRNGLDLDVNSKMSERATSLRRDSDDSPIRTNNSFLHDNVD